MLAAQPRNEAKKPDFGFHDLKVIPHTSVKNQASSGTCWSFSGTGFLEAEIMRLKGVADSVNLSPMWTVRHIYREKVVKYVRMHGEVNLAGGGAFFDVLHANEEYGMVPMDDYQGLNYGFDNHNHGEIDRLLKAVGDAIIKGRKLSTAWLAAVDGILDAYFGKAPEKFTWKGKEYTPKSFESHIGLKVGDYVSSTSFTHHPFYTSFILEIPDNWIYESSYNVPLNEMMKIIDNALDKGYTVAWGSDVSESGFTRDGYAVVPEDKKPEGPGSDQKRWTGEPATAKDAKPVEKNDSIVPLPVEKVITQEMRQLAFDNYETTDDHGMLMVGLAQDKDGKRFYKVKNSWGYYGDYKGYLYVSVPFVQYKTMNIIVHKDAIPAAIKAKLKLK
jgi:aminopeptidase C